MTCHLIAKTNRGCVFANRTKLQGVKFKQPQISQVYFAIYPKVSYHPIKKHKFESCLN